MPAPLVAVAAGIAGAAWLGLKERGVELVGHIPTGLPSLTKPDLSLAAVLWSAAIGIALMSFTETVASGRAFARSDEPPPRANRELLATGLGNVAGAWLGAMPSGGGTSQTAVNRQTGARTQLAEIVTAGATLATMFVLAPLIGLMPQATLAGVVVVYSIGLIKPAEFLAILGIRRTEFVWALAAFAGVMLFGTLKGILVAIILSLAALAYQVADPPVRVLGRKPGTNVFRARSSEHPEDETFPGLLILQPEGRVFFANAERIGQKMQAFIAEAKPRVVAIDLSAVFDLEYTALKMLIEGEKRNREQGVELWLVDLNPAVLTMVQRSAARTDARPRADVLQRGAGGRRLRGEGPRAVLPRTAAFVSVVMGPWSHDGRARRGDRMQGHWWVPARRDGNFHHPTHSRRVMTDVPNPTDWTKPAAMAIPKEGYFKKEQGRYGPVFPKTPACYGFTIIAKIIPGREPVFHEYAKTIEEAVAGPARLPRRAQAALPALGALPDQRRDVLHVPGDLRHRFRQVHRGCGAAVHEPRRSDRRSRISKASRRTGRRTQRRSSSSSAITSARASWNTASTRM